MEKETQAEKVKPITPSPPPPVPPPLPEQRDVSGNTKNPKKKKKKKRGLLKMIKVAIFMLRRTSTASKQTSLWKRIVNAMKSFHNDQLHFDGDYLPRLSIKMAGSNVVVEPVALTTLASDSSSSNSPGCASQYASAQNLQELDNSMHGGAEYSSNDEMYIDDGDIIIDARAEAFIAHFYEQMRLQRSKSLDDHSIRFSLHEF